MAGPRIVQRQTFVCMNNTGLVAELSTSRQRTDHGGTITVWHARVRINETDGIVFAEYEGGESLARGMYAGYCDLLEGIADDDDAFPLPIMAGESEVFP